MVNLARARASDRPDVTRPAPAGFQKEPTDRGLIVRYGLYPAIGKAPNLIWTAKTLCLWTRHGIPCDNSRPLLPSIGTPSGRLKAYLSSTGVCPSITFFAIIAAVDLGTSRVALARTQLNHPEMTLGCFPSASSATRTTFSAGSP